jgi:hypothetical protein
VQKPPHEAGFAQEEATFSVKTLEAMCISYHGFKIKQCQKDTVSPTFPLEELRASANLWPE